VFVLTVLSSLNVDSDKVQCLVIAHTRELAQQAKDEFQRLGKFLKGMKVESFYGGSEPVSSNIQTIRTVKPHIVVGTPGRLKDLICERGELKLDKLRFFVLDESDAMIDDLNMR
jgi:ATP-dependent RNA helicase UAP56/SUB2